VVRRRAARSERRVELERAVVVDAAAVVAPAARDEQPCVLRLHELEADAEPRPRLLHLDRRRVLVPGEVLGVDLDAELSARLARAQASEQQHDDQAVQPIQSNHALSMRGGRHSG
jgi:hypothetical protein